MSDTFLRLVPKVREAINHVDKQNAAAIYKWQFKLVLDDGNVVDYLADRITNASLTDIREALKVAGFAARFPKAVQS